MNFDYALARLKAVFSSSHVASKCGHKTKRAGIIHGYQETSILKMPLLADGTVEYCLDCVSKMSIRCAWCGSAIMVGNPITLYSPKADYKIPEYATRYPESPTALVGCLGWDCADTGGDRAGFWMPGENGIGMVHRVPTMFETMMNSAVSSGVIIHDINDIKEAHNPHTFPT